MRGARVVLPLLLLAGCEPSAPAAAPHAQPTAVSAGAEMHRRGSELEALLDRRNTSKAKPEELARVDAEIRGRYEKPLGVMITDMSGMTSLTKKSGIIGILALIREMQQICLPVVEKHGGRFVKMEADDLFVTHPSAGRLLDAAREMLATLRKHHAETGDDSIRMGIGLGFGPVLDISGEEIWGDAVNTASKLGEDTAEPGEILVTEDFHRAVVAEGGPATGCTRVESGDRKVGFSYFSCK